MFVSIVSTKIPFKGAGKEYVGDDIEEMVAAVKQAIQACGLQVRYVMKVRFAMQCAGVICNIILAQQCAVMIMMLRQAAVARVLASGS